MSVMHKQALFMIAQQTRPPPALAKPGDWSPEFNDFIAKSLVKDPECRASATDLLEVSFLFGMAARVV
jgi:serine/threonine protein kinase